MSNKQVFQADTPGRWTRFKWLSRLLIILLLCGVVGAVITITSKEYPSLPNLTESPKKISKEQLEALKHSTKYKDFKLQKDELQALRHNLRLHQLKHPSNKDRINAAFYVNWDSQSFFSLEDHIGKLDMIVSEWFFIAPGKDTVTSKVDTALMHLNKKYKKPIIAQISNYVNKDNISGGWDTKDVERIIKSKKLRAVFIASVLDKLTKYNLQGVNLDFEDLKDRNNDNFIKFQKELYTALHARKFLVTQDVVPQNDDYDVEELVKYNDYLFIMAYDQHTESSNDGDISHQRWVESQLDDICSQIPSEKVILVVGAYGYDWPENSIGTPVTYQQAISTAFRNKSQIVFNPESANLHFKYTELNGVPHSVYFTDAITNFNIIRMADDWSTAGVALWRLGSEDPRLWSFFDKNLSLDSLKKTGVDKSKLTTVGLNDRIDYSGNGEVLDLVSTPSPGLIDIKLDPKTFNITNQTYVKLPTKYQIRKYGYSPGKIVLTFDDGPDPDYTPQILEILKQEKVPASFFVVGSMVEKNIPLLRQEFEAGYEIGNHTFFHPDVSAISLDRVKLELNATRKLIESITGRSTILFRPPFNADAEPTTIAEVIPVALSREQSYINIGESIDPHDWEPGVTADSIVARVIAQEKNGSMLLLHDAGGDTREETVKALPRIIHFFKSKGYQFTTIADVLGKTRNDLMPPITDDADSGIIGRMYNLFILSIFYGNWFLLYLFLSAIFLAMGRIILIGILALRQFSEDKKDVPERMANINLPPVSIIVPAYNEEITATRTIQSLLETKYKDFEIIFVDDGSKDKTFEIVKAAFEGNPRIKILTKPNGGKASALNWGIAQATHDFVICIDADTQLKDDAVYNLMVYFTDDEIGAVAGTVKVGNENNLITKWQSIEYITAQNMDRRAFDLLNSITVVPGAIGAFRKQAINDAGGFTYDTLAEDCDLTMRILKQGYIVKNCAEAIAYTEAPESISMLLKQRFRWSFGVMQSFWKNRDALFNKKYKFFGMVGMPNILIFQIILPLFSPLADLMMIFGLFGDHKEKIIIYYVAFVLVDLLVGVIAFKLERENYKKLVYIIPQRFVWRQLMYYVLFKSIRRAVKGELSGWGVLKRTGNVTAREGAPKP
ncbi:cellulose synthase/poly-beta-1,6-N-acetylglucosamine synthase-like glycosyltransferase [Mucilaginibacter gracilis]|uniref:Cellulose synthase/poly-beta-1,6-N-acetylglucosamine synthase-like glycosyltransferase n=1 Tax=Mucilaginibacter gracilis TaxID=423350 RepID=A0A495IXV9_9SPHI|nr:glycosyltransferase [Mucilaginibacter gracilis]RKR80908.1 cellulose synthase/poly-beta-1,6-N-acetylglucosamine synthase-like glycosyltransferase [Mucilaginibacter gracilis]